MAHSQAYSKPTEATPPSSGVYALARWVAIRLRPYGVSITLALAIALLAVVFDGHFRIGRWLVWRYGGYWLLTLGFCACATLAGCALLGRLVRAGLPFRERVVLGCPAGILMFGLAWFGLGLVGQLDSFWFVVCPLVFGVAGGWVGRRGWLGLIRHRRLLRARAPATALRSLLLVFGAFGLLLVYLPILTPRNVCADAHWYHVRMAEMYAAAGGIFPFREGWLVGVYPQLATLLYSWAFVAPGTVLFDAVEICAHLEFMLLLATLAGIALLVRRVLPRALRARARTRWSWTALFLFPELFLYDSSLSVGADHVAAFWAAPLFLALLHARRRPGVASFVVLGLMMSGVLLTKYSAYSLVLFPAAWLAGRLVLSARRAVAQRRWLPDELLPGAALVGVVLIATTPHWLKNLIWYGDPLFPWLRAWFEPGPWSPEAESRVARFVAAWPAERSWQGVKATLESLVTFSFKPNDWWSFHRDWPVFGSLFTVTAPVVLWFRGTRRLVYLYLAVHLGLVYWYWSFHLDRYLQALLPWMASAVAAILILVWQAGWLPRCLCAGLVALQLAWGGDVPFFPTHAMVGSPLKASIDFLASGFTGQRKEWFTLYGEWANMRTALPADAKLLLHMDQGQLGLGRVTVSDWFQTGISYVRAPEPDAIYDRLRSLGVTHVLWRDTIPVEDTAGGELAFFFFARRYTVNPRRFGAYTVAELPSSRPDPSAFVDRALYLGCDDWYPSGLYRVRDLDLSPFELPAKHERPTALRRIGTGAEAASELSKVDGLLIKPSCFKLGVGPASYGLVRAATADNGYELWIRRP